jgi:diguanylate cyclase (GGDEF)-like protein
MAQAAVVVPILLALFLVAILALERRLRALDVAALTADLEETADLVDLHATLLDLVGDGIVVIDGTTFSVELMTKPAKALIGPSDVLRPEIALAIGLGQPRRRRSDPMTPDISDAEVWIGTRLVQASPLRFGDGRLAVVLADVTERQREQARLAHLATHDRVTGLIDRESLKRMLATALEPEQHQPFGLLIVDVDRFGSVNRAYGYETGDRLLAQLGKRLRRNVRDSDVVARLGGGSFAIIETGASQLSDLETLSRRICDVAERPVTIDGTQLNVTVSVGGVLSEPGLFATVEDLLSAALDAPRDRDPETATNNGQCVEQGQVSSKRSMDVAHSS